MQRFHRVDNIGSQVCLPGPCRPVRRFSKTTLVVSIDRNTMLREIGSRRIEPVGIIIEAVNGQHHCLDFLVRQPFTQRQVGKIAGLDTFIL